jgi:hypothetical protein
MIRGLLLICVAALCVIFWPGLKFAASSAVRDPVTRNGSAEIAVPRRWSSIAEDSAIAAFTPCWTVFCSKIRSSMEVRFQPAFIGQEDAWLVRTQQTMKIMATSPPAVTTLESPAGKIKCIESSEGTESACIAFGSGLIAGFKGAESDLKTFHSMLVSARALNH